MTFLETAFDMEDPDFVSVIDELPLWSAPFGLKILEAVRYRRNITALDIGFGSGFPLLDLAMRLGKGSTAYGIDPWTGGIERTRKKIAQYGIDNVQLIRGEAENIPLPEQSIDLVVSNNGINNVEDPGTVFSECFRVAREGAQFLATMNTEATMIEFYEVMEDTLRKHGYNEAIAAMKKHIYQKRKPVEEVTGLLGKSGFRLKRVTEDKFGYTFSDGTALLNHFFIRLAFLGAWKNIVPEKARTAVFSEIEAKLNAIAQAKGGVHLSVPFVLIEGEKL